MAALSIDLSETVDITDDGTVFALDLALSESLRLNEWYITKFTVPNNWVESVPSDPSSQFLDPVLFGGPLFGQDMFDTDTTNLWAITDAKSEEWENSNE